MWCYYWKKEDRGALVKSNNLLINWIKYDTLVSVIIDANLLVVEGPALFEYDVCIIKRWAREYKRAKRRAVLCSTIKYECLVSFNIAEVTVGNIVLNYYA